MLGDSFIAEPTIPRTRQLPSSVTTSRIPRVQIAITVVADHDSNGLTIWGGVHWS